MTKLNNISSLLCLLSTTKRRQYECFVFYLERPQTHHTHTHTHRQTEYDNNIEGRKKKATWRIESKGIASVLYSRTAMECQTQRTHFAQNPHIFSTQIKENRYAPAQGGPSVIVNAMIPYKPPRARGNMEIPTMSVFRTAMRTTYKPSNKPSATTAATKAT